MQRTRLIKLVGERLSSERMLHVLGVEQEAVTLAARWGEDAEQASQAALLHDIAKEESNLLKLCKQYDIILSVREIEEKKFMHAPVGAAMAAEMGASAAVVSAVSRHTTGCVGMSRLDKIIFLADAIEPGRSNSDSMAKIRGEAYRDLDLAVRLSMESTMISTLERGEWLNPVTVEARNSLI